MPPLAKRHKRAIWRNAERPPAPTTWPDPSRPGAYSRERRFTGEVPLGGRASRKRGRLLEKGILGGDLGNLSRSYTTLNPQKTVMELPERSDY
jgi:hypothetical protein